MTLQEILTGQGLTDEQVKAITNDMKKNKVYTAGEENLDIRYNELKGKLDSRGKEYDEATALIEQLKKDNAGNEALQDKIKEYDEKTAQLQSELTTTKTEAALKVALLEAKGVDIDYLSYKIKQAGELKLTDDGKLKGFDTMLANLKQEYPNQFAGERKVVEENRLPEGDGKAQAITKQDILNKPYAERAKFYEDNPEVYNEIMEK